MAIEVRPCTREELLAGLTPIFHYFGRVPNEDAIGSLSSVLAPERLHAAFDGGRAVGGAGAFDLPLTVPRGRVAAAGVTTVGVLPTHRRRGVLRAMMRAQLDDVHERGEPVAILWASEGTIYGRFGYGIASLSGGIELARDRSRFVEGIETAGTVRLLDTVAEAIEAIGPVYERVVAETPGMYQRSKAWWETRTLADPEWRRQGGGEQCCAVLEIDGKAEGYALYRLNLSFEGGSSNGVTVVNEAMGATPRAVASIWRFLLDVDWMQRVRASLLPVDHPLLLLLAEPRRAGMTLGDGLWLRLVDVGAALSARSFQGDEAVVLQVTDEFCPWNDGRWRVSAAGAERTRAKADLALDVSALACTYLGGFTFHELAWGGRVSELAKRGLERADRLFYTDRAPWCPEIF